LNIKSADLRKTTFGQIGELQMTKKTFLLGLFVVAAVVGQLNAQTFSTDPFPSNANFGFSLAPMQEQGQYQGYDPEAIKAQNDAKVAPMYAGLKNMAFGLWSWQNGDIFGGALTAGLEVGGIALMIAGAAIDPVDDEALGVAMGLIGGGFAVVAGGAVFGYFRGSGQYKKQNAVAMGFDGNTLEHVSFGIVPGVGGSLIYSARF
jgi:hypothetical protein